MALEHTTPITTHVDNLSSQFFKSKATKIQTSFNHQNKYVISKDSNCFNIEVDWNPFPSLNNIQMDGQPLNIINCYDFISKNVNVSNKCKCSFGSMNLVTHYA